MPITDHSQLHLTFTDSYDMSPTYFDHQYMYTDDNKYLTSRGRYYTGYYHIYYSNTGERMYMEGPYHSDKIHGILTPV